jgi:hypothetical protein
MHDLLFGIAVILMALFSHTDGMLSRIIEYVTVFIAIYIAKVIIDQKLFTNRNFLPILYLYMLVWFIGMRTWPEALRSGYYLMF